MAPIRRCRHCRRSLQGLRIDALYCSDAHRRRAERRRARGLPSDFAPNGWRRGRIALGEKSRIDRLRADLELEILTERLENLTARLLENNVDEARAPEAAREILGLDRKAA